METIFTGSEYSAEDEYLNNSKLLPVSCNIVDFEKPKSGYMYATSDLGDGIVLLARYGFGSLDCVEGMDDYIPGTDGQFNAIPVREFDGRSIAFNKSGLYKGTKSKKECLNVVAAVVKYDAATGTVAELEGTQVSGVTFSSKDGAKNASVSGESITVEKKYKRSADSEEQTAEVQEYKKLGSATIPTFTVKVKGKGDAKPYIKKMNDAFKQNPFPFAIRQLVVGAYNEYESAAVAAKLNKEAVKDNDDKEITTYTNADSEYYERYIATKTGANEDVDFRATKSAPVSLGYYYDGNLKEIPLYLQKFKGAKSKVAVRVTTGSTKKGYKEAYVALKAGTDYDIKSGKLAGDKEVFYLDLKGTNVAYSMIAGYTVGKEYKESIIPKEGYKENDDPDYDDYEKDADEVWWHVKKWKWKKWDEPHYEGNPWYITNLAPFGFKIAFRQSPKDKKLVRIGGVFKEDNVGFVFSE